MSTEIRVRFAPSPTGLLHVGGARTALFNYFFARRYGGRFVLRIEDTDTERSRKEWEDEILFSMKWLGLTWDEGPFYQTKRFDLYRDFAHQLVARGQAYKCFCTPEELDEMRRVAEARGEKPMYDRRWRDRTDHPAGLPFVIRFKAPLDGETVVPDLIRGDVRFANVELDDLILLRSNDTPTYNFTVVVDDIDMKISHVIRGDDHLNNTPKQILIMKALGWTPPQYAHVPMILAPDKSKLSKRHGAVAVSQFRTEGYLPEAMINCLARLGWSHGNQEFFSAEELGQLFDLESCGVAGSVFDRTKLDSINAHYLRQKTPEQLVAAVAENLGDALGDQAQLGFLLETEGKRRLLMAVAQRAVRLQDVVAGVAWLRSEQFRETDSYKSDFTAVVTGAKPGLILALRKALEALPEQEFQAAPVATLFKSLLAEWGLKMPDLAKPTRILLTGTLQSPDIGLVIESLGKQKTLERLADNILTP